MNAVNEARSAAAVPGGIRTWRVGSLSMGVTLILLGTALAVSIWQNIEAYEMLLWVAPVVFMMLGAELLLYLKFSGSDRAIVRYDWMSVFFVGAVGMASLALALLMSTGLFNELQRELSMTQRSAFVDAQTVEVPANVKKIVVQSLSGVTVEESETREVHLFGQVRYWSADQLARLDDKMMKTKIVGTDMYVMIGTVERKDGGLVSDMVDTQLTLVVPKGVEVVQ
ncbi:hypothetical protein KP806_24735 [Paenibacillus sp. N4]|uniref:hypothetical protein n=1 Tax=Paenibacillus vietnamensis TaxID=2590547 RepID=UPI001CD105E5|nr:hypothetical protein [Paenibacillus vietnamensis]MCA0758266.1 hypothetical protein [Paenibacillus vietnamensis]